MPTKNYDTGKASPSKPAPAAPPLPTYKAPAGSSSGGGGAASGGTAPSASSRPASEEDVRAYLQSNYGYLAAFWDMPVVGDILRRAATEGWDQGKLLGALSGTDWWKNTTQSSRQWQALNATDPGEASHRVNEKTIEIAQQARKLGLNMTDERARDLATRAIQYGMTDADIQYAIASELTYKPDLNGTIATAMDQLTGAAASYGVEMSQEQAFGYARSIAAGDISVDNVTELLKNKAKSKYAGLAPLLDQGITVKDFFDEYAQTAARELGVTSASINLMDHKWQVPLDKVNPDGTHTYMTIPEWTKTLRNDQAYGWNKTSNAEKADVELTQRLGKQFGLSV